MGTNTRLRSPSRPRSSISRALAQIRQPGHALPLDSCTVACTSPESLQRRELVQGNRRSARLPAGKWGKCTPKRAFGGLFDVHFPAFLARKEAPARNRAKCTAGCVLPQGTGRSAQRGFGGLMNRPPGPHSARLALIPRPNRANEGGIQSDLLAVRLDVPRACGYRRLLEGAVVARALGRASCGPGGRPSGQPAAFDEAPAGCEEAKARRERGLSEPPKAASSAAAAPERRAVSPRRRGEGRWLAGP